jgi:hypothetical protein
VRAPTFAIEFWYELPGSGMSDVRHAKERMRPSRTKPVRSVALIDDVFSSAM